MTACYMLLGTQRSGTTLVHGTLRQYPEITAYDEVFLASRKADFTYANFVRRQAGGRFRDACLRSSVVNAYLDQLLACDDQSIAAIGFKIMYDQLGLVPYRYPSVFHYAKRKGLKIIHVVRANVFRIVISQTLARHRKQFHLTDDDKPSLDPITVDPRWLLRRIEKISRQQETWRQKIANSDHMEIRYEDFVARKESSVGSLLRYLGVPSTDFRFSGLKKISPHEMDETISNFDEVRKALEQSPFARMLKG